MSTADTDEWLATIVEELFAIEQRGELPDFKRLAGDRPEMEQEVRELWATLSLAQDLGGRSTLATGSTRESTPDPRTFTKELPFQFGDYELLEELGRGGMGIVYKARQISLGRIVALKMILRGDFASEEDIRRFHDEAMATARLQHPNLLPVYTVDERDGWPYFCMQYIDGKTLAMRLADGPLPAREAAELLIPVCRAIGQAHRQNLLHRDLKTSNILIDRNGTPYVTDFGLVKQFRTDAERHEEGHASGSVTISGAILGTPSYMAPEQAAGQRGEVGPATDVYSLGAILYAMLTGRPPFQASSPVDTVLMVLEQDPLPPRLLNQGADPDLEMIALKCLQKPMDLRYASADALADDLEAWLRHEPVSARSSQFTQIISRAFRETHHAGVLENWGLLWMWHSLVLLVLCIVTNLFQFQDITRRWPYVLLWTLGLGVWAAFFWNLRRRSGPITFVERQIAHVWAGSMCASTLLFEIEAQLDLRVLRLSPILGLVSGMVFLVKAGLLSGRFYLQAFALFATSVLMAFLQHPSRPDFGITVFGLISGACFFWPGLKYYRQSRRPA